MDALASQMAPDVTHSYQNCKELWELHRETSLWDHHHKQTEVVLKKKQFLVGGFIDTEQF